MSAGRLVILSGPSGVGKDTIIDQWHALDPRVERVVAVTTRAPRTGEVDGVSYHFVTEERFQQMADDGEFLEHKRVHGFGYATPLKSMQQMLDDGKIAILKIDVQGAEEAMRLRPDALSIFILPPSIEALEKRLRDRGTDDEPTIQRRLTNARGEIEKSAIYHHRVVNDRVERVVEEIRSLVG